jgi:hypothetical protein
MVRRSYNSIMETSQEREIHTLQLVHPRNLDRADTQESHISELGTQESRLAELDTQESRIAELDTQESRIAELDT